MNRTPFMPPLNSRWRLTKDVALPRSVMNYSNEELVEHRYGLTNLHVWLAGWRAKNGDDKWVTDWRAFDDAQKPQTFDIPGGTVISFHRYHASNSGHVQMTIKFIASPDPMLTPKKFGGKGRGPMRFYLDLDEFNMLGELEEASDVHD